MGGKWSSWHSRNNSPRNRSGAPGGWGGWGRWGDYDEVSSAGKASACQPQGMTEARFSRTMTAGELVYFGGVDQMMMGDFYTTKGF